LTLKTSAAALSLCISSNLFHNLNDADNSKRLSHANDKSNINELLIALPKDHFLSFSDNYHPTFFQILKELKKKCYFHTRSQNLKLSKAKSLQAIKSILSS
jgi:hypothetical protein